MNRFIKAIGAVATAIFICIFTSPFETLGQQKTDEYEILYNAKTEQRRETPLLYSPSGFYIATGEEGSTGFDILHNRIDIAIDWAGAFVSGKVDIEFKITAGTLDSIFLHLKSNMTVDSIQKDGLPLSFLHDQDMIFIDLGGTFNQDETLSVEVAYNGHPSDGLRFWGEAIYNLSEPDRARYWFPCYDEPWDKVTSEMIVTIPDTLFCASNGLLISETDHLDGTKTYQWSAGYRHSTYLISVAISNYVFFSHWYHYSPTDSMEMPYYVYPWKYDAALVSFSNAPEMMVFFSETFGQYPFINEKYGTALAPLGGAMENLTCTTFGSGLIFGTHNYDWVIAHEMAHSWFGNSVTMDDWREIWLNEGFATYSDALWHEHSGGDGALAARMAEFREDYFDEDSSSGRFPIYDPTLMWGATVYKKGAWILHMLRYLMGDTVFFDALRTYHSAFAYQNASTNDFRSVCESVSGLDLSNFFSEWIYQAGYPEYEYSWHTYDDGLAYRLNLTVTQVQSNAPVFTIPIEVCVTTVAGDSIFRIPVSGATDIYQFEFTNEPIGFTFDPFDQILKSVVEVPTGVSIPAATPALSAVVYPNPTGGSVWLDILLPEPGDAELEIYDVAGRFIGSIVRKNLSAERNTIELTNGENGINLKRNGVYFYRLRSGGLATTGKLTVIR